MRPATASSRDPHAYYPLSTPTDNPLTHAEKNRRTPNQRRSKSKSRDKHQPGLFNRLIRLTHIQAQKHVSTERICSPRQSPVETPLGRILCDKAVLFYNRETSVERSNESPLRKKGEMQVFLKAEMESTNKNSLLNYELLNIDCKEASGSHCNPTASHTKQIYSLDQYGLGNPSSTPWNHSLLSRQHTDVERPKRPSPGTSVNGNLETPEEAAQLVNVPPILNATLVSQERRLENTSGFSCQLKLESRLNSSVRRSSGSRSSASISLKLRNLRRSLTNSCTDQTLQKIEIHLAGINYLAEYADWMEEFYKDESEWELSKYLVYKRFNSERRRVHQSLTGKDNCFSLKDLEISDSQLHQLISSSQLKELTQTIQKQNQHILSCANRMKRNLEEKEVLVDNRSTEFLYWEVNRELRILADLLDNGVSPQEEQIYKERMVSIMQIVFLMEELEGRFVRSFLDSEELTFREFMDEAYVDYNKIVTKRK